MFSDTVCDARFQNKVYNKNDSSENSAVKEKHWITVMWICLQLL